MGLTVSCHVRGYEVWHRWTIGMRCGCIYPRWYALRLAWLEQPAIKAHEGVILRLHNIISGGVKAFQFSGTLVPIHLHDWKG